MLNRDFSRPRREYVNKNKTLLIVLSLFIVVGIVMMAVLGFNASPDFKGGHVVDVNLGTEVSNSTLDDYESKIKTLLNENNLSLYSVQIKGVGDNTTLEIKYTGKINEDKINKVNAGLIKKLGVEVQELEHLNFGASVGSTEIIYTITAGLIILLIATLFVVFRHNIAYAISLMGTSIFSVLAIMSVFAILRLQINTAFFFIVLGCMVYTMYETLILFEKMREVSSVREDRKDKSKHIVSAFKNGATRLQYTSLALFFLGFLLVVFGTSNSRTIALGFMFAIVVSLMSVSLVLPFIYNMTIDKVALKPIKNKDNKKDSTEKKVEKKEEKTQEKSEEKAEEVVEERYTQEAVDVEVIDTKADTTNSEN